MKIGNMRRRCGKCKLTDYCAGPCKSPKLCQIETLDEIEDKEYKQLTRQITECDIADKMNTYKEGHYKPWDDILRDAEKRRREKDADSKQNKKSNSQYRRISKHICKQ